MRKLPCIDVPNILTSSRIFGIILAFIIASRDLHSAFIVVLASFTTDYFDGKIARLYPNRGDFGGLYDKFTDSLHFVLCAAFLYFYGKADIYFFVVVAMCRYVMDSLRILALVAGVQHALSSTKLTRMTGPAFTALWLYLTIQETAVSMDLHTSAIVAVFTLYLVMATAHFAVLHRRLLAAIFLTKSANNLVDDPDYA